MRPANLALSAFLLAAALPLSAETVLFEEFDHYGYYAGNFNPGVNVTEEPGSIKSLRIEPKDKKYVKAFKTPYTIPQNKRAENIDFTFRYRPFGGDLNKSLDAILTFVKPGEPAKDPKTGKVIPNAPKVINVHLDSEKGCSFTGAVDQTGIGTLNLTPALAELAPFCDWQWYDIGVKIVGGHAVLFVNRGIQRVEARTGIPAGYVLESVNFGTACSCDIDDVKVVALPQLKSIEKYRTVTVDQIGGSLNWKASDNELMFGISNIGYPGRILLNFVDGTGKSTVFSLASFCQEASRPVVKTVPVTQDGKTANVRKVVNEKVKLEDSGLKLTGKGIALNIYTIPRLQYRYESWQARQIVDYVLHGSFERAGVHEWIFRLVKSGDTVQLWIDGNYVTTLKLEGGLKSFSAHASFGANIRTGNRAKTAGLISQLALQPDSPAQIVDILPRQTFAQWLGGKDAVDPNDGFETCVCQENLGSFYLECDGYLSRNAFEGIHNALIKNVPNAQYNKAQIVCSLGENDPDQSTDVTVRITRYWDNGGRTPLASASRTITLPRTKNDPCPDNVRRLGKDRFLVNVDLPVGDMQDVVFPDKNEMKDSLVFEALGGTWEKNNFYLSRQNKPAVRPSNVIVHKAALFKSPVTMKVENGSIGNVFYPEEDHFVTAKLTALKPGKYALVWTVKDVDGKVLDTSTDEIEFKAVGETRDLKKTFSQKEYGYYTFNASLREDEAVLISFDGAFTNLAPDTRKAGYESPYNSWNFVGAHGTPSDPKVFGAVYKRMGVRKTWGWKSEADVPKEYGPITVGQFRSIGIRGKTPEEREKDAEKQIKELTSKFPHTKQALIFHESANGPMPMEIFGEKTNVTEDTKKADEALAKRALEIANAWRKYAPDVKMVIGNTGYSLGGLARLFRAKFPADRIDFMGEESVGMSCPPERSVAYPSWMLAKLAAVYGYKNVRPEACFEWKSRIKRYFESPRQQAAYRVRDILVAHAWQYNLIPVAGMSEMANSYYNTCWGDGAFSRWPIFQPAPLFTATAVATQVLDCVKLVRMVPVGSTTVYMLEFKRGNEFVYACWTVRGKVKVAVDFGGAKVTHTDFFGKITELKGNEVEFGEEPCYLIASNPVKTAAAAMERTYPREVYGSANAQVVCAMDKADGWKLVEGEEKRLVTPYDPPHLAAVKPGKFKFAQVKDDKKGDCLEATLVPEGEIAELMCEYAFIRLDKPAEIAGTPSTLGLWVKGNSTWGKLYFELEDADGEIWLSAGTGGYGCVAYDWPEQMSLNFDGWHFVQFPLTGASPVKVYGPGETQWQWQCDRSGDGKVTFPVKLRGIGFSTTRKTLNLVEMVDVKNLSIRFRDFSAY